MPWTFTVNFKDVNGAAVSAGVLYLSVWTGSGNVQEMPPRPIAGNTFSVSLADNLIHVTIRLQHTNFADCVVVVNRPNSTSSWLWSGSASGISQSGADLSVSAVTRRLQGAPRTMLTDSQVQDLYQKAAVAKASQLQRWAASGQKGDVPFFTDLQASSGVLVRKSMDIQKPDTEIYFPSPVAQNGLHLVKPDPLGDPAKSGWGRFAFVTANGDPARTGAFYLLEYGEVSPLVGQAPRFLVAGWVPLSYFKNSTNPIDFVVWFTPTTQAQFYPPDEFPFRKAYPYEIWAGGAPPSMPAFPTQRYLQLPSLHMTRSQGEPTSHYLTYLMAASGKSAVIVVPVCPAASRAAYEPFISQPGLMRLLKELCMQIALFSQDKPALYGPAPPVGKIVIAGLSAGVQRCEAVISAGSSLDPYTDSRWQSDASEFRRQWKELWSFDAAFLDVKDKTGKVVASGDDQFRAFLNASASWVQQYDDRRLRIYKTDYTAGKNTGSQWDPRVETAAGFARMLKAAAPLQVQASASPWAVSVCDARRRWQCISLSEEYLRDPDGSTGLPEIPIGLDAFKKQNPKAPAGAYKFYHDAVPRMFFGHALLTSGLN